MYCKSCGNKIDNDSHFCSYCGTKLFEINELIPNEKEVLGQEKTKTVNVNVSFSKKNKEQPNHDLVKLNSETKYEPTYKKKTEATIIGAILLVSFLLLVIFQPFNFNQINSNDQVRKIFLNGALVLRIILTIWVVNIAKSQNRKIFSWGLFTFFLPSIALIIIGQKKKILAKFDVDESLSNEENSLMLTKKAQVFINDKKYKECIRFTEKAVELNPYNNIAFDLLVKARLQIPSKEISDKHTQIVYRETTDNQILKIVSKNFQPIGANVFIDNEKAPDGEYYYLKDNRKLTIKTGKIEKIIN